jgi:peptide chain release factor 3
VLPYTIARWISVDPDAASRLTLGSKSRLAVDRDGNAVVLFTSSWELEYAEKENPAVRFAFTHE